LSELYESELELGMLGTLRSELDDETDLDPIFFSMQLAHNAVINAYGDQKINSHATGMILKELKIKGTDGNYWTIGASTKSWYKRKSGDEGVWEIAPEPEGIKLEGEPPYWYVKGVASLINEVSQIEKDIKANENKEELVKESENFEQEPEELEWIFDEWDKGITVAEIETPQLVVGGVGLPEDVPSAWNPDADMFTNIDSLDSYPESYPAGRAGNSVLDALDEQVMEFDLLEESDTSSEANLDSKSEGVDIDNLIAKVSKLEDYFMPYEEPEEVEEVESKQESFENNLKIPPTETTILTPFESDPSSSEVGNEIVEDTSLSSDKFNYEKYVKPYDNTSEFVNENSTNGSSGMLEVPSNSYITGDEVEVEYDTDISIATPTQSFKAIPFTPGKASSYIDHEDQESANIYATDSSEDSNNEENL